ncbi:lysozyme inhibitor LprI family protein [Colwellia echini]|uniref:DUF1311 domain-containing protein n=1 Tax=Colwellia echini TaxID=1982103 RepID=A0ABY3N0N3_9GAMM|nr:lysozyme inhibitor LprI family protein [Colwellia echini]TYK66802.1 DUF1311 domain-containing protein [Colwellia echini]
MTCNTIRLAKFIFDRSNFVKLKVSGFLLCPLLILSPAHAAKSIDECQTKSINNPAQFSMSQCLDSVILHTERELQTWVNLHTFNLEEKSLINGRDSALKMFKRGQSNFITYRENDCRWQYLAISPDDGADLAYKKCYVILTNERITVLKNREELTTAH